MPIPAAAAFATPSSCKKRKMSYRERKSPQRCTRVLFGKSNVHEHKKSIRRGVDYEKHCALCGDTGNHQYICKRLKADFGGEPLPNKNRYARDKLANNLICAVSFPVFPIFTRQLDDQRCVMDEFPTKIKALIIHRRCIINPYLTGDYLLGTSHVNNICIECTFVKEKYVISKRQLFEPSVVVRHVLKSQTNVLVDLMTTTS